MDFNEIFLPSDELIIDIVSSTDNPKYYRGDFSSQVDEVIGIGDTIASELHPSFYAGMLRDTRYFAPGQFDNFIEFVVKQNGYLPAVAALDEAVETYADEVSKFVGSHPELTDYSELPSFSKISDKTQNGVMHCATDAVSAVLESTAGYAIPAFGLERSFKRVNHKFYPPVDYMDLFKIIASDEATQTTGWRYRTISFTGASPSDLKFIYDKAKEKKADEVFCLTPVATPSHGRISDGILHNVFIEGQPIDDIMSVVDIKHWSRTLNNREMDTKEFATRWMLALNVAHIVIAKSV